MPQKFPHFKLGDIANVRAGIPSREIDRPSEDGVIPSKMVGPIALTGTFLSKIEGEDVALPGPVVTRHGLKEGDILTPSRGIFRASLLEKEPEQLSGGFQLVAGPLCHVVRVDAEKAEPAYVAWVLSTPTVQAKMAASARGAAVRLYSRDALAEIEFPLPPIEMQRKLARAARDAQALMIARRDEARLELAITTQELSEILGFNA
jgi:restriction endonuclease S subunit